MDDFDPYKEIMEKAEEKIKKATKRYPPTQDTWAVFANPVNESGEVKVKVELSRVKLWLLMETSGKRFGLTECNGVACVAEDMSNFVRYTNEPDAQKLQKEVEQWWFKKAGIQPL